MIGGNSPQLNFLPVCALNFVYDFFKLFYRFSKLFKLFDDFFLL